MSNPLKIGFIGLGNMGIPMVKNLVKAGFDVTVYNRNSSKAEILKNETGVKTANSPAELLPEADVIITMLTNDAAVKEVYYGQEGILSAKRNKDLVAIDMSTVSPETTKELAAIAQENGFNYLDAPVSGSVKPAEEAQLVIMAGGDAQAFDKVKPVLDTMGKSAILLGANGSGNAAKLAINLFLGITVQGLSEAVLFAKQHGIEPEVLLPLINNGPVGSGITKMKSDPLINLDFKPAFALKLLRKDIGLAEALGMRTPAGTALATTLQNAMDQGLGEEDMIAIYSILSRSDKK